MLDPSRPVPPLPFELVSHIFSLTLPPGTPSWTSFPPRARSLRSLSLLSHTWRAWAQRELVRHVVLRDDDAARAFVRSGAGAGAREVLRREGCVCETLRIGGTTLGRPMDGGRLREVLGTARGGDSEGDGLRELWLVTVRGVDLRELRTLDNLRTLVCVDLQLGLPPSSPQTPVPSTSPSLPRLETLVLKDIELTPSLRTIMFEDHQFPSLAVLYFDSHEVLTQVFDGDPAAMPRLRALSPAADVQPAYLEALHPAADDDDDGEETREGAASSATRRGSIGSARRGSLSRRTSNDSSSSNSKKRGDDELLDGGNLRLLNVTAPFLCHLGHFAPSLPLGITHLRLDFGPSDDVTEQDVRLLVDNADFAELFDPPSPTPTPTRTRTGLQFLTTSGQRGVAGATDMLFGVRVVVGTELRERGVEWGEDTPDALPDGGGCGSEVVAPQDRLVPWGFLKAAGEAMAFDDARRWAEREVEPEGEGRGRG